MAITPTTVTFPVHPADIFLQHGHMDAAVRQLCEHAAHRTPWNGVPSARHTSFGEAVVPARLSGSSLMSDGLSDLTVECGPAREALRVGVPWATQIPGIHRAISKATVPRINFLSHFNTWMLLRWDDDEPLLEACLPEFDIRRARSTIPDEPPYAVFTPHTTEVPTWDEWVGSLR